MKIIENNFIPFGRFHAINIFGVVFVKRPLSAEELNHEAIHTPQQFEWLIFYTGTLLLLMVTCGLSMWWLCSIPLCYHVILYGLLWLVEWALPPHNKAYRDIALEREAYDNQAQMGYLTHRRWFAWIQYLFKRR